jgi:hypothetical protein
MVCRWRPLTVTWKGLILPAVGWCIVGWRPRLATTAEEPMPHAPYDSALVNGSLDSE